MSTTTNHITAEQLWQMGDCSYELLRGELIEVMSPAGNVHGIIVSRLAWIVTSYVLEMGSGQAFTGDVGFVLDRDPDTVLGPDVAYVSQQKLDQLSGTENFLPISPDVAFEVISTHDTFKKVESKAKQYVGFDVPLVVVINPRKRCLHVHRPGANVVEIEAGATFDCGEPAPWRPSAISSPNTARATTGRP